jgi:hypothetical protein
MSEGVPSFSGRQSVLSPLEERKRKQRSKPLADHRTPPVLARYLLNSKPATGQRS